MQTAATSPSLNYFQIESKNSNSQSANEWVFGQNLDQRVVINQSQNDDGSTPTNPNENGSSSSSTSPTEKGPDGPLDLSSDSEKVAEKRKYEVITGEEGFYNTNFNF